MLHLIRGLPASGKTTFSKLIAASLGAHVIAADDFFGDPYVFDGSKLPQAHEQCQERTKVVLKAGGQVLVTNTFSQTWELAPYIAMAEEFKVMLFVVDLFDNGCTDEELFERNIHGVPLEGIKDMRSRWEPDWRSGDPRPPWERGE